MDSNRPQILPLKPATTLTAAMMTPFSFRAHLRSNGAGAGLLLPIGFPGGDLEVHIGFTTPGMVDHDDTNWVPARDATQAPLIYPATGNGEVWNMTSIREGSPYIAIVCTAAQKAWLDANRNGNLMIYVE